MRRRLLLLVVGMTTLVVLAFAVPLAVLIHQGAHDDGVDALRHETSDIAYELRRFNATPTKAQLTAYLGTLDGARSACVQLPDGEVVGTKPPGGADELPRLPPLDPDGDGGAGDPDANGHGRPGGPDPQLSDYHDGVLAQLPVPVFGQGTLYTVRVWASDDEIVSGQDGPLLLLVLASAGLLLLGVVLGELLTRRIVRPLVQTAETAQRLATGDVTARATTSGPPEVAEVGVALNRLADRIDQLIAEERETAADVSHRLRTPLTALRLDVEALRDPVEAERMAAHVGTLERTLTAVIRAARRPQREGRLPACDATAVVGERVEFWSALAEDQGRTSTVQLPDAPLVVRAGAEDLATAVDALLENVLAHTPEGVPFAVRLCADPAGARIEVSDDGPGLSVDEPTRGRSDRGSTGLGLDIARRCAESSGGSMTLGASPSGGASITLLLGVP